MTYYVYWCDKANDATGLDGFPTEQAALDFINKDTSVYCRLIKGWECKLIPAEVVKAYKIAP